jgi:hypothetical protein
MERDDGQSRAGRKAAIDDAAIVIRDGGVTTALPPVCNAGP